MTYINEIKKSIGIAAELSKLRITVFVSISCAVGFVLASMDIDLKMLLPIFGVLFLSFGSAALNHFQEIKTDSLMSRTKNRPLPSKRISKRFALSFIVLSSLLGLFLLAIDGAMPFALGVMSFVWYNLIYTPLKKKTSMAVIPGAVLGALPPAIGWISGGGELLDPKLLALGLFFFIWQIPHFWFIQLLYDEDYRKAGFPTLTMTFGDDQISRISYVWVATLVASCMFIPFFGLTHSLLANVLLFGAGAALLWKTRIILAYYKNQREKNLKFAFISVNAYVLAVIMIITVDKLISL